MKTLLYKSDSGGVTAIGNTNPLPVTFAYDSSNSFNISVHKENAVPGNLLQSATAGKSIYITDVSISVQQAGNVWLYNSDGDVVLQPIYLAANGHYEKSFATPIKVGLDQALWVKTNAQIHVSLQINGIVS